MLSRSETGGNSIRFELIADESSQRKYNRRIATETADSTDRVQAIEFPATQFQLRSDAGVAEPWRLSNSAKVRVMRAAGPRLPSVFPVPRCHPRR